MLPLCRVDVANLHPRESLVNINIDINFNVDIDIECHYSGYTNNEERTMKRTERKKPLPVGLTKEQHQFLEEQSIGKAEYMRNLLVVDMQKHKESKK